MRFYPRNAQTRRDALLGNRNDHSPRNDQSHDSTLARYRPSNQASVAATGTATNPVEAAIVAGLSKALGTLTLTPGAIVDDVIKIDTTHYQFAADPTAGTPDGSVGTPYLVDVGVSDTVSLANLVKAINATGVGGTDYSVEITVAHTTVEATASDATTLSARALTGGTAGNAISTTQSGNDGLAWGGAVLAGGTDARVLTLTLSGNDIWAYDAVSVNSAMITAAFPTAGGIKAALSASDYARTSDTVLTITLPPVGSYSIASEQTYALDLNKELFLNSADNVAVAAAMVVSAD